MIKDTIEFLKSKGFYVFYDAEHFFDGYLRNKDYALETLRSAKNAGCDAVVLCDTNGGMLTHELGTIVRANAVECCGVTLGIQAYLKGCSDHVDLARRGDAREDRSEVRPGVDAHAERAAPKLLVRRPLVPVEHASVFVETRVDESRTHDCLAQELLVEVFLLEQLAGRGIPGGWPECRSR